MIPLDKKWQQMVLNLLETTVVKHLKFYRLESKDPTNDKE